MLRLEQLGFDVVHIRRTNNNVSFDKDSANGDTSCNSLIVYFDLGNRGVGLDLNTVLLGDSLDGFNQCVETTHRVKHSNV